MSTVCPFILNNPPTENGKEGGVIVHHVIDCAAFYVTWIPAAEINRTKKAVFEVF